VFSSGSVAKAVSASSSIPPFFKPALVDGERYVDGAFTNSVPSDVVREMGADYVVAIDLRTENSKANFLTKIFPSYKGKVEEPWAKGYEYADIMLKPNLEGYSSTSFWQANQMYDIGYKTASDYISKIKNDIELLQKNQKKRKG
jgi:NTE family protein